MNESSRCRRNLHRSGAYMSLQISRPHATWCSRPLPTSRSFVPTYRASSTTLLSPSLGKPVPVTSQRHRTRGTFATVQVDSCPRRPSCRTPALPTYVLQQHIERICLARCRCNKLTRANYDSLSSQQCDVREVRDEHVGGSLCALWLLHALFPCRPLASQRSCVLSRLAWPARARTRRHSACQVSLGVHVCSAASMTRGVWQRALRRR